MKHLKILCSIINFDKHIIEGNYLHYFENIDSCFVNRIPLLSIFLDDTLFMHADTLISVPTANGHKKAFAYHKVKIYKSNLQGKCDSLSYQLGDEKMEMFYDPILWTNDNQISADKINFYLSENQLDSMQLFKNPFIISRSDSLQFNQIKGKEMSGYFLKNQLKTLDVNGNGHTLYFIKDQEGLIGINLTFCSDMQIDINKNEIIKINFKTKPESTVYPQNELLFEQQFLEGFNWRGNERPLNKADVFK